MEKLYRAQLWGTDSKTHSPAAQNPIQPDNVARSIIDGDKKSLDYLESSGKIAKATFAARGAFKLSKRDDLQHDYGAYSPYERKNTTPVCIEEESEDEDYKNSWDDIFLAQNEDDNFFISTYNKKDC